MIRSYVGHALPQYAEFSHLITYFNGMTVSCDGGTNSAVQHAARWKRFTADQAHQNLTDGPSRKKGIPAVLLGPEL